MRESTVLSWRDRDYAMLLDKPSQTFFTCWDVGELIDGNGSAILEMDLREINLMTGEAVYQDGLKERARKYAAPVQATLSNGRRLSAFFWVKPLQKNGILS